MRYILRGFNAALVIIAFLVLSTGVEAAEGAHQPGAGMQKLAESMLADIKQTTWISEGKGAQVIYIFFDPNCPYCHRLFVNTRSWVKQGKLELRWIPVGILMTTSEGKAIAILQADDPLAAFYKNEEHYDKGGAIEEDLGSPEVEKKLKANESLLARTHFGAVPVMLFRDQTGVARLITGSPPKTRLMNLLGIVK
jgi:thiol:disulfide interchange protein DsbG